MHSCSKEINVGDTERTISAIAGGGPVRVRLSRLSLRGLIGMAVGGALLYRGITGHCRFYEALEMPTAEGHPAAARSHSGAGPHPWHDVTDASLAATGESPPMSH